MICADGAIDCARLLANHATKARPLPISSSTTSSQITGIMAHTSSDPHLSFSSFSFFLGALHASKHPDIYESDFLSRLRQSQHMDRDCQEIRLFLEHDTLPRDPHRAQFLTQASLSYAVIDDLLVHKARGSSGLKKLRIFVPQTLRHELISYFHSSPLIGAHLGVSSVLHNIFSRFYWPTMFKDVRYVVRVCPVCQRAHSHRIPLAAPSIHATPTSLLFEHLGMDFVGPLPPSLHRNMFILALTDYFSKWAEAYPLPDQSANSVAVCLADWITRYGAPIRITSDRGASFVSEAVASFCRLWGVQQQFASAYHPQANGLVERFNATLVDMLRAFSIESGKLWDEYINACLFPTHFYPFQHQHFS